MTSHEHAAPVARRLLTPGVLMLLALVGAAMIFAIIRFAFGLSVATNLDQQHPWGIWIAIDVATGVALAAGGFTSAALVYVFNRNRFHSLVRPALLTAMLGYTFVGMGLMADLGRYYNIWHPALPSMWQGNSVLFEVGMCVMCYLTVLYIEFLPLVCERFIGDTGRPRLARLCARIDRVVRRTMFVFILAGVVLSCLHQSSLGHLMVIAPTKMHALWYTPLLGLLFLLSAAAVGFPMIIVESLWSSWSFSRQPEMHLLRELARFIPPLLGVYLAFIIGNMAVRETYGELRTVSPQTVCFGIEVAAGVVLPLVMLLMDRVRRSPRLLLTACLLIVFGVAFNRINVFLVAYQPPFAERAYFPSVGEIVVTTGLMAGLVLVYRVIVTYLPVLTPTSRSVAT
ncbi:MAG: Ni/Fe-hydrogenase cytochrome b subunit [Phycisphaerales bacterium]|nr:Ni/Fe-hydrogenase cytochrome b subunit [Phycisphaerales bacterium]